MKFARSYLNLLYKTRLIMCVDTRKTTLHGFHVILTLLLIELTLLFGGGVLVLLVLGDQVVHVGFGLGELHLVHTLTGVPVQESLTTEHTSEVLSDTLEH